MMSVKLKIKSLAHKLGFDAIGVAPIRSIFQGETFVKKWVGQGCHGDMRYLAELSTRRRKFFDDFKDAKSVIVLGVNYYQGRKNALRGPHDQMSKGRVARYAWGKDYHFVIRKRHEELIARIREIVGEKFRAKSCVDAQPLAERFIASRAGLGFLGKHTGILNPKFGPWLFLSEIVTNLDLEPDPPSQGNCGTCSRCQKACPTEALDQAYQMDARRCISYLTIEFKGEIANELKPKIGNWIFGCDECLNACPFTSKAKKTRWKEFLADQSLGEWVDIEELLKISSNREYRRKFFETALVRAHRKQMRRNAGIVAGNAAGLNKPG